MLRKATKGKEQEKGPKELEAMSRRIQLTQAVADPSIHAAQGGRRQPITKECLEKLFRNRGELGLGSGRFQEFERQIEVFMSLKKRTKF